MPWQECTVIDQRQEFVTLAQQGGTTMRELCRRFGISPKTGYKLVHRHAVDGVAGLVDRPRRPHTTPTATLPVIVAGICALRRQHGWGGRKIHHFMRRHHMVGTPAPSTITAILQRAGELTSPDAPVTGTFIRFEHAAPNDLWQMDFLGHKPLQHDQRVHPLVVLDDHSRYLVCLEAATNEQHATVQTALIATFRRYGLPTAILADNGPTWGTMGTPGWTQMAVWLARLGVELRHGRPYHPQTQGKVERLNRTIGTDVFGTRIFPDVEAAQTAFDTFRQVYNHDRPHEALGHDVPDEHYRVSSRSYPHPLPAITYAADATVRQVGHNGTISYAGYRIHIGESFRGLPVGIIATATTDRFRVRFLHYDLGAIDLRQLDKTASRCYLCP